MDSGGMRVLDVVFLCGNCSCSYLAQMALPFLILKMFQTVFKVLSVK